MLQSELKLRLWTNENAFPGGKALVTFKLRAISMIELRLAAGPVSRSPVLQVTKAAAVSGFTINLLFRRWRFLGRWRFRARG